MTPRQMDLVTVLFELEPPHTYPARAAAAASELVGASGFRLALRDGTEHQGGTPMAPTDTSSIVLSAAGEELGTLYLSGAPASQSPAPSTVPVSRIAAAFLGRGLRYSRRLSPAREPTRALAESPLTPRERDVVAKLVAGSSTRDIAATMSLTVSTVNTYMKRIFAKIGVHSRVELVAWVNGTRP